MVLQGFQLVIYGHYPVQAGLGDWSVGLPAG